MELLTHFLPKALSQSVTLAWCLVGEEYPRDILTPAEDREYQSFESPHRQQEYLATRWLVRQMAGEMKADAAAFNVEKDELGKPFGTHKEKTYHLSIAHTRERVMCAISTHKAIGVDLEPLGRAVQERLRSRIINPSEHVLLKQMETLRIWTLKEALVKLQGQGMRTNLNECLITEITGRDIFAKFNNDKRAKICSFAYKNNWLAIAYNL